MLGYSAIATDPIAAQGGYFYAPYTPDPSRTFVVQAQDRTLRIAAQNRVARIAASDRKFNVT